MIEDMLVVWVSSSKLYTNKYTISYKCLAIDILKILYIHGSKGPYQKFQQFLKT